MTAHKIKPTCDQVQPIVHALYASRHGAVGGCWHIVLDDGNVDNDSVRWCVDHVADGGLDGVPREGHEYCVMLADLLPHMSYTQRKKLSRSAYKRPHQTSPCPKPEMPQWRQP